MVDIQSSILEKLRCSKCNGFLSYAPIMITEDGRNLCGRCVDYNSDVKLIQNIAYEDIAAIAAFPCRYKESGCDVIIPWEDVIIHEDHCEYRPTECPVAPTGTCKWKGPQCTLLDHYKETHPECILEHPCSLDTDVVVDNDKNMLLSFLGFVFLVQIRCNTALSKLWHCVHCFAVPQAAKQFNFCVKFSNDDSGFEKKKPVLAEKCLTMQIDKSIETNVNTLLEILGDYKNIKVVLSILPKVDTDLLNVFLCSKCKDPALPAVFRDHDKYYCSKCKLEILSLSDRNKEYLYGKVLKSCKNNRFGCPYININKKLIYRHEIWECTWKKTGSRDLELNDFVKGANNSILEKNLDINCWHYGHANEKYLCKILVKKSYLEVYVYSKLPIEDIHLYKCEIKFMGYCGPKLTLKCTPTAEHDWELHETFLDYNHYITEKDNKTIFHICRITISKKT